VEKANLPIPILCRVLEVSRAGFYAWLHGLPSARAREDERLRELILAAFVKGRGHYGSPRIHRELRPERISRKRVIRLMQEEGLAARVRRRFRCTTDSSHVLPVARNILARDFKADAPNQRWAGDTTGLVTPSGRLFLATIVDLDSRFVVGWALSAVNARRLTLTALDMDIRRRCPKKGLLHHSDSGSTYASEGYQNVLESHGIDCSMSRRGNCYDNAAMESWNSTLKAVLGEHFDSPADAKEKCFDYSEVFYNQKRLHSTIDYRSPAEFERIHRQSAIAA